MVPPPYAGAEAETTIPGATQSAIAVRGVGNCGNALEFSCSFIGCGIQYNQYTCVIYVCGIHVVYMFFQSQALTRHSNTIQLLRYIRGWRIAGHGSPRFFSYISRQEASVGRQTPSSASKTRTVLNCRAKVAPSSSQSCDAGGVRKRMLCWCWLTDVDCWMLDTVALTAPHLHSHPQPLRRIAACMLEMSLKTSHTSIDALRDMPSS